MAERKRLLVVSRVHETLGSGENTRSGIPESIEGSGWRGTEVDRAVFPSAGYSDNEEKGWSGRVVGLKEFGDAGGIGGAGRQCPWIRRSGMVPNSLDRLRLESNCLLIRSKDTLEFFGFEVWRSVDSLHYQVRKMFARAHPTN